MERTTQEEKENFEVLEVLEEPLTEEEEMMVKELEFLDDELEYLNDTLTEIEEIKKKPEIIKKVNKELSYFSNSIFIFTFLYIEERGEFKIFQVYDRNKEKSTYHFIADPRMEKSLLLNLINKGESYGNKRGYI